MNNSIKCSVETCKYYENNYCSANQIMVRDQNSPSHTNEDTQCSTFQEK